MSDIKQQFPKLFKYMTINHNINYIDPSKRNPNQKFKDQCVIKNSNESFINITKYPHNLAFTEQSWYEGGPGSNDFIYYPYHYAFGVPNNKWNDNYGGFIN